MNEMNNPAMIPAVHISRENMLARSHWYGPNLATIIAHSSETNGAFSLVKTILRKGFEPPLHVHSREDENNYVLDGEILYTVGEEQIHARAGDYIHLPKNIPHTFKLISDTASTLLLIIPGGFEALFIECGRPAEALELPPLNGKPSAAFFEKLLRVNESLGTTILPAL